MLNIILHLARASSKFLGRTIKDVGLPQIKKVDCRDVMPYIVADICLKIVLNNDTEFGALQMVKGNKEVYEGHMVDTKTRKVIEDSQISLTVEKKHTLVKILPTKQELFIFLEVYRHFFLLGISDIFSFCTVCYFSLRG